MSTSQRIVLKEGEIFFEPEQIIIKKNKLNPRRWILLSSGIWIFYALIPVLRSQKEQSENNIDEIKHCASQYLSQKPAL